MIKLSLEPTTKVLKGTVTEQNRLRLRFNWVLDSGGSGQLLSRVKDLELCLSDPMKQKSHADLPQPDHAKY